MMIKKIWDDELEEFVETFVDETEIELIVKTNIVKFDHKKYHMSKRQQIADKYGVSYGTRFYNFDIKNNLTEYEFEEMCKLISKGKSLKMAHYEILKVAKSWEGFEEQMGR